MIRNLFLASCVMAMAACSQPPTPSTTSAPAAPAASSTSLAIPPPPPGLAIAKNTPEAWRVAFDSSFHIMGPSKEQGDGVTKFDACFDAVAPEKLKDCHLLATGEKDAFRKLWIFKSIFSGILSLASDSPFLIDYVSVRENHSPVFLMSSHYVGESWLFMTDIAIMVDGDIVLEHHFDRTDVQTHVGNGYVEESSDFILTSQQIDGLRKIHPSSKVIIRFTGKNGYVSVDHDSKAKGAKFHLFNTDSFASDVQGALGAYDAISAKTQGKDVLTP